MHRQRDTETAGSGATVLSIQRMSTEDGPGLRTTVFFKGCSLACRWCQNPEAMSPKLQLVWHDWKCIGAGRCDAVCPEDAIRRDGKAVAIDAGRCTLCGECADECPTTALEMLGAHWRLDDLVAEVLKDRSYYETSGGGVTVSGGEPALQPTFIASFLDRCRADGVHTALDTCGMCGAAALDALAGRADLVLYDVKEIDAERHARLTGQSNEKILANLVALGGRIRSGDTPAALWIRTPLIPGATATDANLRGIGAFIAGNLGGAVRRWELCAFNNLARDKYRRMGLAWDFNETELLTEPALRRFADVARASGVDPGIVVASGPTRRAPASGGA